MSTKKKKTLPTKLIQLFRKKEKIVTHSGSFHADDVFAAAALTLALNRKRVPWEIIRTRDENTIKEADYVFDVGGEYDPEKNRFDHHQPGGAGERENGIPYAAFGLIWKHFGPELCNDNQEVFEEIDKKLVQPIDAIDNGISITRESELGIYDYGIHGIISAFQNSWKEASDEKKRYESFMKLVSFFRETLDREIQRSIDRLELLKLIEDAYQKSEQKEIIEVPYPIGIAEMVQALHKYPEVQYVIAKRSDGNWKVMAMRKNPYRFENRKSLPESWAGKRGEELQKATGVSDAVFCHNERWLAIAETREGAWKLAELALID